ncbi:MAG: transcription termination/antitermination protein NusG [Gemmatimonadota bacterium]|nr:transcription termination/antitermination protein NusG [Gemmatimonadota bacterium]
MGEAAAADALRWYAIQTYSGHENKVKSLLEKKIGDLPGEPEEKQVREVIVPTREVVEIKGGKKVKTTKRLYPGYVLVNMMLNQETMFLVTSTPSVIKFLGGGTEPQPLRQDEINKILGVAETTEDESGPQEDIPFEPGQVVEVMEGPFSDFSGTVEEVFPDKGKVRVQVSLFGRPTSVELDYTQLKGY